MAVGRLDALDGVELSHALHTLLMGGAPEEKGQQAIHTAMNYQIEKVAEKFLEDFNEILFS